MSFFIHTVCVPCYSKIYLVSNMKCKIPDFPILPSLCLISVTLSVLVKTFSLPPLRSILFPCWSSSSTSSSPLWLLMLSKLLFSVVESFASPTKEKAGSLILAVRFCRDSNKLPGVPNAQHLKRMIDHSKRMTLWYNLIPALRLYFRSLFSLWILLLSASSLSSSINRCLYCCLIWRSSSSFCSRTASTFDNSPVDWL